MVKLGMLLSHVTKANLPNGQTGIKTHAITKEGMEEIFTVTLDWDVFMTGSTNSTLNSAEYNYPSHKLLVQREQVSR